jgi:hypothetical protein
MTMPSTYLFIYRQPRGYRTGDEATMAAWAAWFKGMGTAVLDRGDPVIESGTVGDCGAATELGGHSVIAADSLEAALALARECPALADRGGVEVGLVAEPSPAA